MGSSSDLGGPAEGATIRGQGWAVKLNVWMRRIKIFNRLFMGLMEYLFREFPAQRRAGLLSSRERMWYLI
jgi:hypothetical protein